VHDRKKAGDFFPAAPPRLVLAREFTKNLRGYPIGFSSLSAEAFSLLPVDSRAAFPSRGGPSRFDHRRHAF